MAPAKKKAPLPHVVAPKITVKVRATISAFGRDDWRIVRPNQLIANEMAVDVPDSATQKEKDAASAAMIGNLNRYFKAHIHPDDRDAFMDAALHAEGVDLEYLMDLVGEMGEAAYADLETPAK